MGIVRLEVWYGQEQKYFSAVDLVLDYWLFPATGMGIVSGVGA